MTVAGSPQARAYSPFDITSHDFWSRPFAERDHTFARLRASDGLSWHQPLSTLFDVSEPGFWALTRRADIQFTSQHPELFTSTHGVALDPMPADVQKFASFFLTMDPPEHTTYRRLISSAACPGSGSVVNAPPRVTVCTAWPSMSENHNSPSNQRGPSPKQNPSASCVVRTGTASTVIATYLYKIHL